MCHCPLVYANCRLWPSLITSLTRVHIPSVEAGKHWGYGWPRDLNPGPLWWKLAPYRSELSRQPNFFSLWTLQRRGRLWTRFWLQTLQRRGRDFPDRLEFFSSSNSSKAWSWLSRYTWIFLVFELFKGVVVFAPVFDFKLFKGKVVTFRMDLNFFSLRRRGRRPLKGGKRDFYFSW